MTDPMSEFRRAMESAGDNWEPVPLRERDIEHMLRQAQDLGLKVPKKVREAAEASAKLRATHPRQAAARRADLQGLGSKVDRYQRQADIEAVLDGTDPAEVAEGPDLRAEYEAALAKAERQMRIAKDGARAARRNLVAEMSEKPFIDALSKAWRSIVHADLDPETTTLAEYKAAEATADQLARLLFDLYSAAVGEQSPEVRKALRKSFLEERPYDFPTVVRIKRKLRRAADQTPEARWARQRVAERKAAKQKAHETARMAALARTGRTTTDTDDQASA